MDATIPGAPLPEATAVSRTLAQRLTAFLAPLLAQVDRQVDQRLVRTLAATVVALVRSRNPLLSLLLTELGEEITDGPHAPAGVKRLWRLLRSPKWTGQEIDAWLLAEADAAIARVRAQDGEAYAILDGSVVEKPAAKLIEGLTIVRSAAGRRLQRAIGGPPGRPLLVPGIPWVSVVVTGARGSLTLARQHWYSPKAPAGAAQSQGEAEQAVLRPLLARWRTTVLWLLDRGFGNPGFLAPLLAQPFRFVVRWRKDYRLMDPLGTVATASQHTRHLRSRWKRQVWDPPRHTYVTVGIASLPVYLPGTDRLLWLVVVRRPGKKESLWLLTSEAAGTEAGAAAVVGAYARRWQVEWGFRFEKSELGIASIRVRGWTARQKLARIATVVHAFLLHLLVSDAGGLVAPLLRWCHRTGRRARAAVAPLYRLRHAISNLWKTAHPTLVWSG